MVRGTEQGFRDWVPDGTRIPTNLVEALEAAGDIFAAAPQVQADLWGDDYDEILAVAEYHQIMYWMELAGGPDEGEADMSQDILCPLGASMIEGVKEPQFSTIAVRAQRHLRRKGLWFPNPNRLAVLDYGLAPLYGPYHYGPYQYYA